MLKKEYQLFSKRAATTLEATFVFVNAYVIENSSYKAHFTASFECFDETSTKPCRFTRPPRYHSSILIRIAPIF